MNSGSQTDAEAQGELTPYLSPLGAWAFALGASIGWGSLIVTSSTYLTQAGPLGSCLGMLIGLAIMLVVAGSYHYMMQDRPNAGGVYAYARDIFGYDHGVLVAWFLALTYMAMFWANVTSIPLFARFFIGDLFQFGPHYSLFGYEVYLGEALLSVAFIALAGLVLQQGKRGVARAVIAMATIIVLGIIACFCGSVAQYDAASFSLDPLFVPGSSAFVQVASIAAISSWAFIGFESVSNSASEFAFPRKHSFKVLAAALCVVTLLYILLTLLSVTAYPGSYATWLDYIADLGSQSGILGVPAFYATWHYLGNAGVAALMVVLLCLVFTSLITVPLALSRLFHCLAHDGVLPARLAHLNGNGVPSRAVWAVMLASLIIPFLGRTTIGWIVDVTTIGATIVYGFVSACAFKDSRSSGNPVERACGIIGLAFMVVFAGYLLVPGFFANGSMATETYILFAFWSLLGFVFFHHLLRVDEKRHFGKSVVSWVMLLALTLFTCLAWMGQYSDEAVSGTVADLHAHYVQSPDALSVDVQDDEFASRAVERLDRSITTGVFVISGMLVFSIAVVLSNFSTMRKREEERHQEASVAQTAANTDPLTGVKSKNAYVEREAQLNEQLARGSLADLGIVVCDVNGLKQVNDTQGHKAGDAYIKAASDMVCAFFKRSPVYRVGGDEFVVILHGADYETRDEIVEELVRQSRENRENGKVVVAAGLATLDPTADSDIHAVFERADAAMYLCKRTLKGGEDAR